VLVDELLVVGDEGLGNGLTDGVDLGSVTTTGDADTDVDVGELVEADNQERLVDLGGGKVLVFLGLSSFHCSDLQDKFCSHLQFFSNMVKPLQAWNSTRASWRGYKRRLRVGSGG
jgi:hypothetical protein